MTEEGHPIGRLLGAVGAAYPWEVEASEDLRLALEFLGQPADPEAVVRGGYVVGAAVAACLGGLAVFASDGYRHVFALVAVAVGLLVTHVIHATPRLWAKARRTRALGAAPDLVARAVLSMRLSPSPERAAAFTARTGEGKLATSLGEHVRANRDAPGSGLHSFGDAWADLFPSLRRSVSLVSAAGDAPDEDRDRLLDRALSVVMDGTRDGMAAFGARVRTPATALYAFGVLLPTALVALLPAGGAVGVAVTPASVVLLYNLVLPAAVFGAAVWLLVHRPVAFPPPAITRDHPDVPARGVLVASVAVAVGLIAAVTVAQFTPAWGPPIAGTGISVGFALWLRYGPIVSLYDRIDRVEQSLPDALTLVGRRVANGSAVETALAAAAAELDEPVGDLLAAGVRRQRQLQIGVEEAFLGRHGALERLPSPRVRGSFALLSVAAREGRPAGTALLALAEHVGELRGIEREAREDLAHVCRTLQTTGAFFAPMVAGATVALAGGIDARALRADAGQSLVWLGGPVGGYVLVLAVLLPTLSVGLTRGFDRALVGHRAGQALVCATSTYLGAYLLVGQLL